MMSSNFRGAAPEGWRNSGKSSTAQASDAQDDRIARFWYRVRSVSLTTSMGWLNARAGCSSASISPADVRAIDIVPSMLVRGRFEQEAEPPHTRFLGRVERFRRLGAAADCNLPRLHRFGDL